MLASLCLMLGIIGASNISAASIPTIATDIVDKVKETLDLENNYEIEWIDEEPNGGHYVYWKASTDKARSSNLETGIDKNGHIYSAYFLNQHCEYEGDENILGSREEMRKYAEECIFKLIPGSEGHIKVNENPDSNYDFGSRYEYNYTRCENGYVVPSEKIWISINKCDGQLASVDIIWDYEIEFPKVENIISTKKALKKFMKKAALSLHYDLANSYHIEKNEYIYDHWVYLAYWPQYGIVDVDAETGKVSVIKTGYTNNEFTSYDPYEDGIYLGDEIKSSKVDNIVRDKDLLSSESVFANILTDKYLQISPNLKEKTAKLFYKEEKYYWLLSMSNGVYSDPEYDYDFDESKPIREYFTAIVNAETGELSYFLSSDSKDVKTVEELRDASKLSKKKCKKIFGRFLKTVFPDGYANSQISGLENGKSVYDSQTDKNIITSYMVSYTRFYNGIPFNCDGASGSVDRITGKVSYYYNNWSNYDIPKTDGVVSVKKAVKSMYANNGGNPSYIIYSKRDNLGNVISKTVKLVYRYEIGELSSGIVDAFTGKMLNQDGTER